MKRGRLPLTALRSFESAGRLGSFTAAAEELFVSQAAISRQVRELETLVGRPLFNRLHRAVVLTEEGEALLRVLTSGFDIFDSALTAIIANASVQSLTISSEPTFAALWLVPRLHSFRATYPEVDVTIEAASQVIEFRASEAELAIRFSEVHSQWPRTQSRLLMPAEMIPIIAPALLEEMPDNKAPRDLLRFSLLHEEKRRFWNQWFDLAGVTDREPERGPVFADGSLVIQAVLRGHGVGLHDRTLVGPEIDAGGLVIPFDISLPCGAYYLVARDFSRLSPGAKCFADWIMAEFASR